MKPIFYWRDIIGNKDNFAPYTKELSQLAQGEYKSLSLEKLRSPRLTPIYSIRVNKKDRLLFTTYNGSLCLLDVIKEHDYHKSRFLRTPQVLKAFLKKLSQNDEANTNEDNALTGVFESIDTLDDIEASAQPIVLQSVSVYKDCLVHFNDEQEHSLSMPTPAVIYGPAGSGKTCVAISMLEQHVRNNERLYGDAPQPAALYVTRSKSLVAELQAVWERTVADPKHRKQVTFVRLKHLFQQQGDSYRAWTKSTDFERWYADKQKSDVLKALSTKTIWQEFRIRSGYDNPADYIALGQKQSCSFITDSATRTALRVEISNLFNTYIKKLDHEKAIAIELNPPPAQQKYSLVLVDEAQDCSYAQLSTLSNYAANNQIVYFLGDHQILFDGKSRIPFLRSWFYNNDIDLAEQKLPKTYRCAQEVVDVANLLIRFKYQLVGGAADKVETTTILPATFEHTSGSLRWHNTAETETLITQTKSTSVAVITLPQHAEEARQILNTPLVFTAEQIKGLEYDSVIVWKPFTTESAKQASKVLHTMPYPEKENDLINRPKAGQGDESLQPYFNELITAVTRARYDVTFVQDEERGIQELINRIKPHFKKAVTDTPHEVVSSSNTSLADWEHEAKRLWQAGNKIQATDIALSKLKLSDDAIKAFFEPTTEPLTKPQSTPFKPDESPKVRLKVKKQSKPQTVTKEIKAEVDRPILPAMNDDQMETLLNNYLKKVSTSAKTSWIEADTQLLKLLTKNPITVKVFLKCIASHMKFLMYLPLKSWKNNAEANAVIKNGITNMEQIIKPMLEFVPDLEVAIKSGMSPLSVILEVNLIQPIKILYDLGVDVNASDKNGSTALYLAACFGHTKQLKSLLNCGADLKKLSIDGETPVIGAAKFGHAATVRFLKQHHVDLDQGDQYGNRGVHYAAKFGHMEVLRALRECGADLSLEDNTGSNAVCHAASQGSDEALKFLVSNGADINQAHRTNRTTAVFHATMHGNLETLSTLHQLKANFFQVDSYGSSLMHYAAQYGQVPIMKSLNQFGVNYNANNHSGTTPVFVAATYNKLSVFEFLDEKGIDFNQRSGVGATLAFICAKSNSVDCLVFLIRKNPICLDIPFIHSYDGWVELGVACNVEASAKAKIKERLAKGDSKEQIALLPLDIAEIMGHQRIIGYINNYKLAQQSVKDAMGGKTPAGITNSFNADLVREFKKSLSSIDSNFAFFSTENFNNERVASDASPSPEGSFT